MSPPAGTPTWAMRRVAPEASCSRSVTAPPARKPLGSVPFRPVSTLGNPVEVIRSLRPKKPLNPLPALLDGSAEASAIATPLEPVAEMLRAPLEKLAEPLTPSAVFRTPRKVPGVKLAAVPPSTLMVPAPKSMSTRDFITPL